MKINFYPWVKHTHIQTQVWEDLISNSTHLKKTKTKTKMTAFAVNSPAAKSVFTVTLKQ